MNINWVLIISGVAAVGGGLIGVIARMMFDAWTKRSTVVKNFKSTLQTESRKQPHVIT